MRYFLFLLAVTFCSCGEPIPIESRSEKLAKSLCDCTAQLITLNEAAQNTPDSLAFRNIATAFEKTKDCVSGLEIKPEDRAGIESVMDKKCPKLSSQKELLIELLGQ